MYSLTASELASTHLEYADIARPFPGGSGKIPRMDDGPVPVEKINEVWSTVEHRLPGDETVVLTDDPSRVDVAALSGFLSTEAYWGRWRTADDIKQQLAGSWRVVTAHHNGRMVGFARALSDGVGLAYLADVYVLPDVRGLGVGRALVRLMVDDGPGPGSDGCSTHWMLTPCTAGSDSPIRRTHTWNDRDTGAARHAEGPMGDEHDGTGLASVPRCPRC